MAVLDDPLFLALLAVLILFVLFIYLFLRRTILGFREGFERGGR